MRIDGGNYQNHTGHQTSHHVTDCVHSAQETPLKGKIGMSSNLGVEQNKPMITEPQQNTDLFPKDFFQKILDGGKNLWLKIWGNSTDTALAQEEPFRDVLEDKISEKNAGEIYAPIGKMPMAEQNQKAEIQNQFFVVPEQEKPKGLFARFKIKVETATGYLANRFPFAQTGSFQAKKEQNKEDLRKKSKYRKDDAEIDCILTDDSYLMDSYNRKGEYSKITTDK